MNNTDIQNRIIVEEIDYLNHVDPIRNAKRHTWDFRRASLRKTIIDHHGDLSTFYHWPVIRAAMLTGKTEQTQVTYDALRPTYKKVAVDPTVGGSRTVKIPMFKNRASGTFARQAYACQLLADAGMLTEPAGGQTIFEFGGGFGALAYVLGQLGQQGLHTIYDYPELSIIQRWYHSQLGVENVISLSNIDELSPEESFYNTFISICALDEAPEEMREKILYKFVAENYFIWVSAANMIPEKSPGKSTKQWFSDFFKNLGYDVEWLDVLHPGQMLMLARA